MKVLLIGSGGREHALAWKLAQSPHVRQLWCAPGNAGISQERLAANDGMIECVGIGAEELPALLAFAEEKKPDLTVVGPDNALGMGIVDMFEEKGLRIWGPNRQAAQFEASKVFAQQFMEKHGIPTPRSAVFSEPAPARAYAESLGGKCAVKADGLALGKGVIVCRDMGEVSGALHQIMTERAFGPAGQRVVVQELLEGREISLHALCDGTSLQLFPSSQDYKRAREGGKGPNTGGMGAYSPAGAVGEVELAELKRKVLDPWLKGCQEAGITFRGLLYPGLMLTDEGAKVLEFNVRFGDPEAQVYLARLQNDLFEVLTASLEGNLSKVSLQWSPEASLCVVLASEGYPGPYEKGKAISGLTEAAALDGSKVFHAGTAYQDDKVVTHGGRVLGVTAWGNDLAAARQKAYETVEKIEFEGRSYRRDIGA